MHSRRCRFLVLFATVVVLTAAMAAGRATLPQTPPPTGQWYRGNLHTHSLWSDGDDYPEMIVAWYKEHGYHFLALSDHNVLSQGRRWIDVANSRGGRDALARYQARFGSTWVEQREIDGKRSARLKPLGEFRHLFEEPERFLLMQGEEITDRFWANGGTIYPVHLNATNLLQLIPPQGGASVAETLQKNVDAVMQQRETTGQPMIVHVNHPNYGWAVTAEDLAGLKGERFFEVYNGHPAVGNAGDDLHAGTERMWDIILTQRIAQGNAEPMFGLATDDSHNYHEFGGKQSNPGRGWIMVRAPHLSPEAIIAAMERGDFYATSGVTLKDVQFDGSRLKLAIDAQEGATYRTQFIGTRQGYDAASEPITGENGQPLHVTRRYSPDVGSVLAESDGLQPAYTLRGDELYVRARVTSSKPHPNPFAAGDAEMAWTQPVRPKGPEE